MVVEIGGDVGGDCYRESGLMVRRCDKVRMRCGVGIVTKRERERERKRERVG